MLAEAVDKMTDSIQALGMTQADEILEAWFPKAEKKKENSGQELVVSPVEDLRKRILDLVDQDTHTIDLASVRTVVYGHEGLKAYPNTSLRALVAQTAKGVEIVIDKHTQTIDAIMA